MKYHPKKDDYNNKVGNKYKHIIRGTYQKRIKSLIEIYMQDNL